MLNIFSVGVGDDTPEAEIKRQALQVPQVQSFLTAQKVSRMIYVPERLVNIVTA